MHWKEPEVWKLSHEMVLDVYGLTSSFPDYEKFRLTGQLCRAASSVPANIVEGNAQTQGKSTFSSWSQQEPVLRRLDTIACWLGILAILNH